jgi:hypothetical protein
MKVRKDGVIEWLQPPPVPFKIISQTRQRFSEIVPLNPFLLIAFRIIRFLCGEGRWFMPEWTRNWRCIWRAEILIGTHKGQEFIHTSRQACIDWELAMFHQPKFME